MNIGIDLDGVLTNYRKFAIEKGQKYCEENGKGRLVNPKAYYINDMFNWDEETEVDFWTQNIFLYAENNPAIPVASDNIKKLKKDGNTIFIITARLFASPDTECSDEIKEKMRKTVKNWLDKNQIEYDYLIFSRENKTKDIIENNIDIMIEDSPNNLKKLSELTQMICVDWPYNKSVENDNIYRCYNWNEIYKKIIEIGKNKKEIKNGYNN